jgi:predicted dehydrogenase
MNPIRPFESQPDSHALSPGINRRQFIKTTAAASAAVGPFLNLAGKSPPSERVRLGFIGCGGRARQIMPMFKSNPDVEIPAICDVIEPRMGQAMAVLAKGPNPQKPESVVAYQRILERKDIDAVVIATTQHWHGLPHIHACQAGKHVFVEKPLSHTVVEGRAMVKAAEKSGVITLMGTQQRAGPHYQKAINIVQSGRLGKIALVECWNYHNTRQRVGRRPDSEPPPGYHWDLWLGPAPAVPFNFSRLDNSWWFDYGGGMLTNWAIHHIDIILWAMQVSSPTAVACSGGKFVVDDLADTPDTIEAAWEFPGFVMAYHYRGFNNFHFVQQRPNHHGICFHGNQATLVLDRFGYEIWDDANPKDSVQKAHAVPYFSETEPMKSEQDGPWQRMFVDCVKTAKKPPMELEAGHQGTVCCHLANIAYRVGRKIQWDAKAERIIGDPEADRLLDRPRRQGFELPQV